MSYDWKNFKPRQNPPHLIPYRHKAIGCYPECLPQHIPQHRVYRCPIERVVYVSEKHLVVAQGILFDGVNAEQYLVLTKKNGGKQWVWTDCLPEYKKRKSIWKIL